MESKRKWTCNVPNNYATQALRLIIRLGGVYRAASLIAELNTALIRKLIKSELISDWEFSGIQSFSLPECQTTQLIRALEIEISRWELPFDEGGCGGFVPPEAWPAVLSAARLDGLVLSSEDLDPRLSPVYKPLPNVQKAYLHAHDLAPPPDDPEIREYLDGHRVSTKGVIYPIRKRRRKKYAPKLE